MVDFKRPALSEIVNDIRTDLASRHGNDPLRRSDDTISAMAFAGAVDGLYEYIKHISKQILPDTAEGEALYRHAAIEGVEPLKATPSQGVATFPSDTSGIIAQGALLQSGENDYEVLSEATEIDGVITVNIQCKASGQSGNRNPGDKISLVNSIAGVASDGLVVSLSGGTDDEKDSELLSRLLARIQAPPHGGAKADYIEWAKEVEGVTRAWVYPLVNGPGSIGLIFVRDNDSDFIPDANEVDEVQEYIDTVRPVTAEVNVAAPTVKILDISVSISPNNAETQTSIIEEVSDFLLRESEPGKTIRLSRLREAISVAAGENFHEMTSPSNDITHSTYEMAKLGVITFSEAT